MKNLVVSFLVFLLSVWLPLAVNATVIYRNMSYTPVRTSYVCTFSENTCTVYKETYLQRNRSYYKAVCNGTSFQQGRYTNRAESDVRTKRYRHCTLVSTD